MREFSEDERSIIRKLGEKDQFFSDLFEPKFLKDLIIRVVNDNLENEHVIELIVKDPENISPDEASMKLGHRLPVITSTIARTVNVVQYLRSNSYIYSYNPAHGRVVESYIGLPDVIQEYRDHKDRFRVTRYPDDYTPRYIFEFLNLIFVATEALNEYAKRGYKTIIQQRHEETITMAKRAIGVSIILGLAAILTAFFYSNDLVVLWECCCFNECY